MRRIFAIALPLALVMALSSNAFATGTKITTYDVGTIDLPDSSTVQTFSFSRSAWESLDSLSFAGDVVIGSSTFVEDFRLRIIDPNLITEEDDGVLYTVAWAGNDSSADEEWPTGTGSEKWNQQNDGHYTATLTPGLGFDGAHGEQLWLAFDQFGTSQTWTDVTIEATVTVVPEPASAGLLGLGALALLRRRRRTRLA